MKKQDEEKREEIDGRLIYRLAERMVGARPHVEVSTTGADFRIFQFNGEWVHEQAPSGGCNGSCDLYADEVLNITVSGDKTKALVMGLDEFYEWAGWRPIADEQPAERTW